MIDDHSQRPEIRPEVHVLGVHHLFGAHVVRRPDHRACGRHAKRLGGALRLGDPEVQDLHEQVVVGGEHEDVVGLDVPMDDADGMRAAERLARLGEDLRRVLKTHTT